MSAWMLLTTSFGSAFAEELKLGFPLRGGETAPADLQCFDSTGQFALSGALLRGEKAENYARDCARRLSETVPKLPAWYENRWLVFSLGLAFGLGGAVAAGITL
jgi:hypothetical protein